MENLKKAIIKILGFIIFVMLFWAFCIFAPLKILKELKPKELDIVQPISNTEKAFAIIGLFLCFAFWSFIIYLIIDVL